MNRRKIHLPDGSFTLFAQDSMQTISQNMFDELNFDLFSYRRQYADGTSIHLMNKGEDGRGGSFLKALYSEGLYMPVHDIEKLTASPPSNPAKLFGFITPKFTIADSLADRAPYQRHLEIAQLFTIGINKAVFFQSFNGFIEMSTFGSSYYETGDFCNFCIANLSVLQNFVKYFRSHAKGLIEAAMEDPIMIDPSLTYKTPETNLLNFVGYDFKEKRKITLQLTEQEANSLELLAAGKTVEEVAKNLQLSAHIVKSHIGEALKKSECQSIYGLLKIFPTLAHR